MEVLITFHMLKYYIYICYNICICVYEYKYDELDSIDVTINGNVLSVKPYAKFYIILLHICMYA